MANGAFPKEVIKMKRSLWSVVYSTCAPQLVHGAKGTSAKNLRIDTITLVDQLAGWSNVAQNPKLAKTSNLPAWLYYEVIKGERYWYVYFELYHPIDEKSYPFGLGNHPHDLEWIMIVYDPQRDRVIAGMSLAHHMWFWGYVPGTGVRPKVRNYNIRELDIDPATNQPRFYVEPGGHGIRMFDPSKLPMRHIKYVPSTNLAGIPAETDWIPGSIGPFMVVPYRLRRITELFQRRYDRHVFVQADGQDHLVVSDESGKLVPSPANALWTSCPKSQLQSIGGHQFSPVVLDPNQILRKAFYGLDKDKIDPANNPFLN